MSPGYAITPSPNFPTLTLTLTLNHVCGGGLDPEQGLVQVLPKRPRGLARTSGVECARHHSGQAIQYNRSLPALKEALHAAPRALGALDEAYDGNLG